MNCLSFLRFLRRDSGFEVCLICIQEKVRHEWKLFLKNTNVVYIKGVISMNRVHLTQEFVDSKL